MNRKSVVCFVAGFLLACASSVAIAAGADVPDYRQNGWASPVDFRSYESCYQFRQYEGHVGNDLCRDPKTPVLAIADGCVEDYNPQAADYGGTNRQRGGVILLRHYTDDGKVFFAVYGHVTPSKEYLDSRKCGKDETVKKGDQIAEVLVYIGGANHLHIGTRPNAMDPERKYRGNQCLDAQGRTRSDNCGFTDPVAFFKNHRPATLIAKGEQDVFHVAGYVLIGSQLCASATSVHQVTDNGADSSDYRVTEATNREDACRSITGTIQKGGEEVQAHDGVIKASRLPGVLPAISVWLSKVSSVFDWIFRSEARAASISGSDPVIQKRLAVPNRARIYQIAGTDKKIVFLIDGPGMKGDKAINSTPYAEVLGPLGPYAPKLGDGAKGKRPDLTIDDLWTEKGNGQNHENIPWGDTVCLAAKVKNSGSANTPHDVKVAFFLSRGEKEDKHPRPVGKENIRARNLEKGEKKTEKRCLTPRDDDYPSYPGKFNFGVHVDPDNTIAESSKKNNYKGGQVFTLSEHARLSVVSFRLSQTTPVAGTEVTVYLQMNNTGTPFHSDKVNIQYRIAGPQYGTHPTIIGFDQIKRSNLRPGDVKTESIAFTLTTTPGTYSLTAEIDYDRRTNQSNRSGNVGTITFTLQE